LSRARGKYVTYLDDDDMYYPCHVETLTTALEQNPQYGAAYSDLYKAHCRIESDGRRTVLSKIVEVSRDFDRFFLLHFNHVLHVSLMHRRDLLEKTGLYNEDLQILIDWDITRRLSFFTDFLHVPRITGEYYGPVGECDRISVQMRKDVSKYLTNVLKIRTSRPSKPWPKMKDLSIIFIPHRLDQQEADTLRTIWMVTFHPFTLILPQPQESEEVIKINMPNMKSVSVSHTATVTEKVDAALSVCEGDYVAIVSSEVKPKLAWVEDSLYAMINRAHGRCLAICHLKKVLLPQKLQCERRRHRNCLLDSMTCFNMHVCWSRRVIGEMPPGTMMLLAQTAKTRYGCGRWRRERGLRPVRTERPPNLPPK
jgi:hypothetical protein